MAAIPVPYVGTIVLTWAGVIKAAAIAGALIGSYFLAPRAKPPSAGEVSRKGWQANTCDTTIPLPLIYGRCKVGINRVFVGTSGVDNKFLHIIGNICEGEIEGIVEKDGVPQIFLGDDLYTKFGDKFHYELFTGSSTQTVCSTLHEAIPDWNDPKKNTAYIYVRLEYDSNLFSGLPDVTMIIDGMKDIYDPETEITGFTRNPALIARDFMTRRRGGMGISADRIDDDFTIEAKNYCEEKGWLCDLVLNDSTVASDMLESILITFRGSVLFSSDCYKIKFSDIDFESPVLEVDDDLIVESNGETTLTITQPSIFDTPNAVILKWTNPEKKYTSDEYQLADLNLQSSDGYVREENYNVLGMTDNANVIKMANYFLERARINKTASFSAHPLLAQIEPHDLITVSHRRPGWYSKIMRATSVSLDFDGNVALSLIEEDALIYDDSYNLVEHTFYDTNLPNPSDPVPPVSNVSISEEIYFFRGRSFTRLIVSWNPPLNYPWFDFVDVWVNIGEAGWKYQTTARAEYMIDPVQEGEIYNVKLVSNSIWGTKEDFETAMSVSHTVSGSTGLPPDVTGLTALASGDTISIFADRHDNPDIAFYEVRIGASWNAGIYAGANETPNIRLVGVRPGTLTIWMKTAKIGIDGDILYSPNAVSCQVTSFGPANYSEKDSWVWDYDDIGTFENTEHVVISGVDSLQCSHTNGVLTGKWTSPIYDLGSIQTVRIWGDFITGIESEEMTWGGVFVQSITRDPLVTSDGYNLKTAAGEQLLISTGIAEYDKWGTRIQPGQRWFQVWAPSGVGGVSAKLHYGTVDVSNEIAGFELSAPEISARYVQVEITITDPNAGTNNYVNQLTMKTAYWS